MRSRGSSGRWSRTAPLAALLLILTLAGHTAAAGMLPSLAAVAIAAAPAIALTLAVSDRRRSFAWLAAYLLLGQLLLHVVLSAASGHVHALIPQPGMVLAHAIAGTLAAAAFAHGEQIAARWMAYLGQALGTPALLLPSVDPLLVPAPAGPIEHAVGAILAHHVARRGPPALAA